MLKAGRLRCKRHRPYESQHHVKRAQERIYKQQEGAHLVTKEATRLGWLRCVIRAQTLAQYLTDGSTVLFAIDKRQSKQPHQPPPPPQQTNGWCCDEGLVGSCCLQSSFLHARHMCVGLHRLARTVSGASASPPVLSMNGSSGRPAMMVSSSSNA